MVDTSDNKGNNASGYLTLEGADGQQIKIHKRDLVWTRTNTHEHHYVPDFSDETDTYVALTCAIPGCIRGILHRKEGKDFMKWLDEHRTTS